MELETNKGKAAITIILLVLTVRKGLVLRLILEVTDTCQTDNDLISMGFRLMYQNLNNIFANIKNNTLFPFYFLIYSNKSIYFKLYIN